MLRPTKETQTWRRLQDYSEPFFRDGALIRFRTLHTGGGDGIEYALATKIDANTEISFVGLDGRTWGYGRCTLPPESKYELRNYTVSVQWLLANFHYIAEPENDDIWIMGFALPWLGDLIEENGVFVD